MQLNVSPTTVSIAWGLLRKQKMVTGYKRSGIWVSNTSGPRAERVKETDDTVIGDMLDLRWAFPDPALLPSYEKALQSSISVGGLNSYDNTPIIPELEQQIRKNWPYSADAMLVANSASDGLGMLLQGLLLPGSVVAVEAPTLLILLDLLDYLQIRVIPVQCDHEGPVPAELARALAQNPVAFIYQPRTHLLTGHSVSPDRMLYLTALLQNSNTLIIEHDSLDGLSAKPLVSLGNHYPERTFHIRSYAKSYGPDLRLAVISGCDKMVEQLYNFRHLSADWSSRFLQGALAWLLQDAETERLILHGRAIYDQRRSALVEALAKRGVFVGLHDGLSLWLEVPSEKQALSVLTEHGVSVMPGSRCGEISRPHIRVSTSRLPIDKVEVVADAIAQACRHIR
ncbi:MAG: aminotransferase class I/II-fold pyridoxal phosphate-dependent enzyme [Enterobacteriaceae bacterium]